MMLNEMSIFHQKMKNSNNYFTFFYEFAQLGAPEIEFLYTTTCHRRMIEFYMAHTSKN
eukprot:TRINITY_DN7574_c0_g1_i1.p3 TRINITY_DN7574_c0_g1~~TRINITY_DN7574_c0_g1_i1.p3  ORF type:complete len:58 (+),score=7.24 TRINITY_DN7574_c0_g1_i1:306-479(+)